MILRHVKSFRQGLFKKTRAFDRSLIQSWADGYLILAIAPMIMLIQTRRIEKPRLRFVVIGLTELLVIGLIWPVVHFIE